MAKEVVMELKEYIITLKKEELDFLDLLLGRLNKVDCDRITGDGNWVINSKIYDDIQKIYDFPEAEY